MRNRKIRRKMIAAFEIFCALILFLSLKSPGKRIYSIDRNEPGEGKQKVELMVHYDETTYPVYVQVGERTYAPDELEAVFSEGKARLDELWLGENKDAEKVTEKLGFIGSIEDLGLTVRWIPEPFRFVRSDGSLTEAAMEAAPVEVKLHAILGYEGEERQYEYTCTIQKPDSEGNVPEAMQKAADSAAVQAPSEERVTLPESVEGKAVIWYLPGNKNGVKLILFVHIIGVLLYFTAKEKERGKLKERQAALERDYPDIVYKMLLMIGAGMTVRHAWEKMVTDYRHLNKVHGGVRPGYEEMTVALREMKCGSPERKAYEHFGQRCGSQKYIRFVSLLDQQIRRGARGMNQLLAREIIETEIMRKENARCRAEEAGMKLVFPMILLMIVVFSILIIPAFITLDL